MARNDAQNGMSKTDLRCRWRKKMPGEHDKDVGLSKEDELRRILNGVFDYFSTDLRERITRLATLNEKFGFLLCRLLS